MRKLFEFIRSIYVVVLFLLAEVTALFYYSHSTVYAQARLLTRITRVTGSVQGLYTRWGHYWALGEENRRLTCRLIELEEELERYRSADEQARLAAYLTDSLRQSEYLYTTARVISTRINAGNNYLILKGGTAQGIQKGMAVLSPSGAMAGYVVYSEKNHAAALSIISRDFRTGGRLLNGGEQVGSIGWTGEDRDHVCLTELSKYATPRLGDTILSTGHSDYFPQDIPIGTVERFELNPTQTQYRVDVRLAVDITGLRDVLLVRKRDRREIETLEERIKRRHQ